MAGIFFSCENDLTEVDKFKIDRDAPNQVTNDLEFIQTDSGRVQYSIKVAVVEEYTEEKLTKFGGGFVLDFYDRDGNVRSRLSGINGENYSYNKKMRVMDSVIFQNFATKQVLYTEELIWDQAKHLIFTRKDVRIVEDNNKVLTGVGLVTDEDFNDPLILDPAGDYYMKKKDTVK